MSDDTPLHMATIDELWSEIEKRCVACVTAFSLKEDDAADGEYTRFKRNGSPNATTGLAHRLLNMVDVWNADDRGDEDDD